MRYENRDRDRDGGRDIQIGISLHSLPSVFEKKYMKTTPSTAYVIMRKYTCVTTHNYLLSPKKVEKASKNLNANPYYSFFVLPFLLP